MKMKKILSAMFLLAVMLMMPLMGRSQIDCTGSNACEVVIHQHSTSIWGWYDCSISVYQGTQFRGQTAQTTTMETETSIQVCAGDSISFNWTGSYFSSSAVSFEILDASGNTLYTCTSGSNLSDGLFFTTMATCPTCIRPSWVSADSITTNSAYIVWPLDTNAYIGYEIEHGLSGFTPGNGAGIIHTVYTTSNDTTLYVDLLQTNTLYDAYVRNICTPGDTSGRTLYTFRTACSEFLNLPYTETFDSYDGGVMPPCWFNLDATSSYPVTTNSSYNTYQNSGHSMELRNNVTLASSRVPIPANQIYTSFVYQNNYGSAGDLQVGYLTDLSNPSSFVLVHTIPYTENGWHTGEVDFSLYTTSVDTVYLAFRQANATSSWSSMYLDNIHIERASNCPQVENARIYNITNSSATVVWDAIPSAHYTVAWGVNDDVDQRIDSVFCYTDSVTINTLQGDVNYYLWIRTECIDGSTSRWLCVGNFTTDPDCILSNLMVNPVDTAHAVASWDYVYNNYYSPYFHIKYRRPTDMTWTADSINTNQYLLSNLTPGSTYQFVVWNDCQDTLSTSFYVSDCDSVQIGVSNATSNYMPIYTSNGYSYTQQIFRSSELAALGDTIYGISFYHPSTETGTRTLDLYLGATSQDVFNTDADFIPLSQLTLIDSNLSWNVVANGLCSITFPTPYHYDGSSNLAVAINDHTGSYASYSGFNAQTLDRNASVYYYNWGGACNVANPNDDYGYVVNTRNTIVFNTNCPSGCPKPVVSVSEVANNQATLQWTAASNSIWQIEYRSDNSDTSWSLYDTTSLNNITLTGLNGGTEYEFRVSANCSQPRYGYAAAFTTCGTISVPYVEGFDNGLPYCWNAIASTAQINAQEFQLSQGYLVLPEVDCSVSGLQLRFQVRSTYDSVALIAGVMTANDEPTSFTPTDTVYTGSTNNNQYLTADFSNYLGGDRFIALYAPSSKTVYLDNFSLDYPPTCQEPGVLVVDSVEQYSVTLSWADSSNADNWTIEYGPAGYAEGSGTFIEVNENPATLYGLLPATDYEASVRAICNSVDSSYRTSRVAFTTLCAPVTTIPYSVNFDSDASGELPHCWNVAYCALSDNYYQPEVYNYSYYAHSGSNSLYMYGTSLLVMPELDATINELQMSFWMRYGYTTGYGLQVGVMSDPSDTSTFVPVTTVSCNDSTSYTFYTIPFANYSGNGRFIALRNVDLASHSNYVELYVDDITIDYVDGCIRPQDLFVVSFNDTSVSLQWTAVGGATQWQVGYDTVATASPANLLTIDSTHGTIGGLTPTVPYFFYVRSFCSTSESSPWVGPVTAVPASHTMSRNQCDTITVCNAVIFDNGGFNNPYHSDSYDTLVIMPATPGAAISLRGDYDVAYIFDEFYVYNGIGTSGEALVHNVYTPRYADHATLDEIVSTDPSGALTLVLNGPRGADGFEFYTRCVECLPIQLNVTDKTSLTATFQATADHYQLQYRDIRDSVWSSLIHNDSADLYINTLTPATRYAVRARTICDNGDTSLWGPTYYFATNHCPATVLNIPTIDSTDVDQVSWELPVNVFYEYSYSQQIFDSAELGGYQEIGAISMYYDYPTPTTAKNSVIIYMANTSQSTFSNITSFVTAGLQEVYRGPLCAREGWNEIPLDTTFTYFGNDNLLIAFEDLSNNIDPNFIHMNNAEHNEFSFRTHPTADNKAIVTFNAQDPVNPSNAITNLTTYKNYRNDIRFLSCTNPCTNPVIDSVSASEYEVTVYWEGNADNYDITIGHPVDTTGTYTDIITVSGNYHTFTDLRPNTGYTIALRQNCGFEFGVSNWVFDTARTLSLSCGTPTNLHLDSINNHNAYVSWTPAGDEPKWYIYAEGTFGQLLDSCEAPSYNLANLTANTTYRLSVQSVCYPEYGIYGNWSDTIEFTTLDCDTVNDVVVTVSGTTAIVSWTPGIDEGTYEISYGYPDFYQGTGTNIEGLTTTSYTITDLEPETSYDLYVRTQCGYMFYSVWSPKVTFTTGTLGIDDVDFTNMHMQVYPNPTAGTTTLQLQGVQGTFVMEVMDMTGRTIMRRNMVCSGNCTHHIDLGSLASGQYFIKVYNAATSTIQKVVVK